MDDDRQEPIIFLAFANQLDRLARYLCELRWEAIFASLEVKSFQQGIKT